MKPSFQELINEVKKHDFYPQGGEAKLAYTLPPHKAVIGMKDIFGVNYPPAITYIKSGYMPVFWARSSMKKVADFFLQKQRENPKFIDDVEKNWKTAKQIFEKTADRLLKTDLKNLKLPELIQYFKEVSEKGYEQWKHIIFLDSFDLEGDKILSEEIKNFDKTLLDEVGFLTQPSEMSYMQKEKLGLLKTALFIWQENLVDSFLKTENFNGLNKKIQRLIKIHQQNFYWYKNNYAYIVLLDEQFFFEELKRLVSLNTPEKVKTQIDRIEKGHEEKVKKRDDLVKGLPESLQNIVYFFQRMSHLRDVRKADHCILITIMKLVLQAMAERTGIDLQIMENLAFWEAERLLEKDKEFLEELEARNKEVASIASEKFGFFFLTGREAEELKTLLEESIMKNVSELIGRPASQGKARGKVKIINKVDEFEKFKKGEILITSMTRPEFVPLMEKAAAIVTDEGGLTCHAAIVSRELGVPCVVGTEIATRVLKDGDEVEVDAVRGLVKLIK